MGKKKCWFTYVKRIFLPESKPKSEESPQKSKKWRWFLEKFSFRQYPALESPPQTILDEATEEHRKRALVVAIATAAAAEAAVAAANAAAEVVRLTNIPYEIQRTKQRSAAIIKIQSAYRGHLARKALSALKGIVKLQAVVRGELVRKAVAEKLALMPFFSKPKPKLHQERVVTLLDYLNHGEKRHSLCLKERIKSEKLKLQCNEDRGWDFRLVSEGEMEAYCLRKQEAIAKREHMKQYSYSHRERRDDQSLLELITHKENRKSSHFDQCKELKLHKHEEKESHKPFSHSKTTEVDMSQLAQLKLRTSLKQEMIEELNSHSSLPRRSFCDGKQKLIQDDGSLPNSPVFPTYMAATESAKAKSRSLSTPKQRLRLCDTYSGQNSPHKLRLSSWGSFNSDTTTSTKRNSISQQLSANMRTLQCD